MSIENMGELNSPSHLAALDASPLWDGAFGMTVQFPAKVQSCLPGSHPFRLLPLVAATFPKGTALAIKANFPA